MATTTAAQQILMHATDDWRQNVPEKFWELVNQYRDDLLRQAMSVVGSKEDAEDVVQETFAEAFRNFDTLTQAKSIGDWLKLVNRRNAMDRARGSRRASRKALGKEGLMDDTFTTGGFSAVELEDSIGKAMQKIDPELRKMVELRFWDGLSYKEIGQRMKLSTDAVQRRMLSATSQLYVFLKAHQDPKSRKAK